MGVNLLKFIGCYFFWLKTVSCRYTQFPLGTWLAFQSFPPFLFFLAMKHLEMGGVYLTYWRCGAGGGEVSLILGLSFSVSSY